MSENTTMRQKIQLCDCRRALIKSVSICIVSLLPVAMLLPSALPPPTAQDPWAILQRITLQHFPEPVPRVHPSQAWSH